MNKRVGNALDRGIRFVNRVFQSDAHARRRNVHGTIQDFSESWHASRHQVTTLASRVKRVEGHLHDWLRQRLRCDSSWHVTSTNPRFEDFVFDDFKKSCVHPIATHAQHV